MPVDAPNAAGLVEQVKQQWLSGSIPGRSGASAAQLAAFEARYGVRLPPDLREYFSVLNGMGGGGMCENFLTFLPLDEVKAVPEELATFGGVPDYREIVRTLPDPQNWYVIVDFLITSAVYAVRLIPGAEVNPVILISDGITVRQVAGSFSAFLHLYLTDPRSLL